jgi:phage head maturation protease
MKMYASFSKLDQDERRVYGYASTEVLDSQGEIVTRDALLKALPDFMRFANIREMHQPSAVGTAEDAQVDGRGLYVTAKIEDPAAWAKVKTQIYKGFSIAGQVTARDPANPHVITGCTLSEISLVDRPANPEAVFDLYKANTAAGLAKAGARNSKADLARIQAIHDHAADLGACCGSGPMAAGDDDPDAPDDAPLGKAASDLERMLAAFDQSLRRVVARIDALEQRAQPPRGALRAIGKGEDVGAPETAPAPGDTHALIKAALARPRLF